MLIDCELNTSFIFVARTWLEQLEEPYTKRKFCTKQATFWVILSRNVWLKQEMKIHQSWNWNQIQSVMQLLQLFIEQKIRKIRRTRHILVHIILNHIRFVKNQLSSSKNENLYRRIRDFLLKISFFLSLNL